MSSNAPSVAEEAIRLLPEYSTARLLRAVIIDEGVIKHTGAFCSCVDSFPAADQTPIHLSQLLKRQHRIQTLSTLERKYLGANNILKLSSQAVHLGAQAHM